MCSCSTKRENIWSSWPIAAFKVCLRFLCMCYFCANFSCSKQTLISLPCCHAVFSSPPVHLHTRAHKGRVHVIHIWVAARFIFIHYCNILEAVQAILFILTTVTTFPIYLYSTHFVTHYQSIYTNLSSAINIIDAWDLLIIIRVPRLTKEVRKTVSFLPGKAFDSFSKTDVSHRKCHGIMCDQQDWPAEGQRLSAPAEKHRLFQRN